MIDVSAGGYDGIAFDTVVCVLCMYKSQIFALFD